MNRFSTPAPINPNPKNQRRQESQPEQRVEPQMIGMPGWLRRMSPRTRTLLGLAIICVLVVGAFFAPPQGMSMNVSGDTPPTAPTAPTVTNLIEKVTINHTLQYRGVQITVLDAALASRFSDDRSRAGKYTVRVMVRTQNPGQTMVGIEYNNIVRLVTANGTTIAPKRISIKPLE
ncbi:MAG: hypothetical protein IMW89_18475, partial [Ktedonobacteraceae bacterium]|nr:hypothetical protein [Ktedonobacteraceae bacterium]